MGEEKVFWMIYVEGGRAPERKHETRESAVVEAKRLARVTGKKVYILESMEYMELSDVEWHGLDTDSIPFCV